MKSINSYIIENEIYRLNEGLLAKLSNWFKNLFKDQETLIKNPIEVELNNIKSPNEPSKLKDVEANKEEMNLINNPKIGFPLTSNLIKQKDKYLTITDNKGNKKEYDVLVNRYFYVDKNKKFDVGIILFDDHNMNNDGYVNVFNIEVIDNIENKDDLLTDINNIFEAKMKKNGFKGAQYIFSEPKIKNTFIKLKYRPQNNDKNILFKNFK